MEEEIESGSGHSRVQDFLLGTLKVCTQQRYAEALEVLGTKLEEAEGMTIDGMDEEGLDYWIADWMVEEAEAAALLGPGPISLSRVLSSAQFCRPSRKPGHGSGSRCLGKFMMPGGFGSLRSRRLLRRRKF